MRRERPQPSGSSFSRRHPGSIRARWRSALPREASAANLDRRIAGANLDPLVTAAIDADNPKKINLTVIVPGASGNAMVIEVTPALALAKSSPDFAGGVDADTNPTAPVPAKPAKGWINVTGVAAGNKIGIKVNSSSAPAVEFTFVTSVPDYDLQKIPLGADDPATAVNLVARITAANAPPAAVTAAAVPLDRVVNLTARAPGTAGNAILLDSSGAIMLSGALLSGGTFSAVNDQPVVGSFDTALYQVPQVVPAGATGSATDAQAGKLGVWVPRVERITPQRFGKYDGTNGHALLQAMADAAARHGLVGVIDRPYKVHRHVRVPSNTIWEAGSAEASITSVNGGTGPYQSAIVLDSGWAGTFLPNAIGRHASAVYQKNTDGQLETIPGTNISTYTTDASLIGQPVVIYEPLVEWYDCARVEPGKEITLLNYRDLAKLPIGTFILIRDKQYYYGNQGNNPLYLMANRRVLREGESDVGGTIRLSHAITRAIENPQICVGNYPLALYTTGTGQARHVKKGRPATDFFGSRGYEENGQLSNTNYPSSPNRGLLAVAHNIRLYGIGFESAGDGIVPGNTAVSGYGVGLDYDFDIPWMKGRVGCFFQSMTGCRIRIGRADVWEKGVELALGGAGSQIEIGSIIGHKHRNTDAAAIINMGENVTDTELRIGSLIMEDGQKRPDYAIAARACRGLHIQVEHLVAPVTEALVGSSTPSATGASTAARARARAKTSGSRSARPKARTRR